MTDKLAMAAMKNKSVQNAVKKSLIESMIGKDQTEAEEDQRTHDASVIEGLYILTFSPLICCLQLRHGHDFSVLTL